METIQHYLLDQNSPNTQTRYIQGSLWTRMSELFPEQLGCPKYDQGPEDLSTLKSRKWQVSTNLE